MRLTLAIVVLQRVDDAALLRGIAHEHLAARVKRDHTGEQAPALLITENMDAPASSACDDGVRRA